MSLSGIPFGKYGYAAHVQELGDKLQYIRQCKNDIKKRMKAYGEKPGQAAAVERLEQEEIAAKAAYDRAVAENI